MRVVILCLLLLTSVHGEQWEVRMTDTTGHEIPVHMITPDTAPSPWPLLLFMHGDPCMWWWYEYLAKYVAPSGYAVGLMASHEPVGSPPALSHDMRFALDYLYDQARTNQSSKLFNKLTFKAAAGGHSAGSDASLLVMGKSDREYKNQYDAVFAQAPFINGEIKRAVEGRLNTPKVFLLSGSSDCMCPPTGAVPVYELLPEGDFCKIYGMVVNGTHCHFADILAIDNVCYKVEEAACPASKKNRTIVPRQIQLNLSQQFLLQFLDASLKDAAGSELQQQHFDALHNAMEAQVKAGYMANVVYSCKV
eukprot:Sspe_Gene.12638::Locus_4312_Transcript_1_1_Confidence_1.000_Length_2096::g.12638::m.12638